MKKPTLSDISPNSQRLIAVCVVLFVSIFSYDWLLAPNCQYLRASERKGRFDEVLHKRARSLELSGRRFGKRVEELRAARTKAGERLFGKSEAEAFFAGLPAAAEACDCRIDSVAFQTLRDPREWTELTDLNPATLQFRCVRVHLEGPYEGWIGFLEKVESSGRLLKMRRFEMAAGGRSDQRLRGELEMIVPILLEIPETLLVAVPVTEADRKWAGEGR